MNFILLWMLGELQSYQLLPWSIFISITVGAACFGRGWVIVVGHIPVAVAVLYFDLQWIQAEMHAPDWDGTPDQDIVFMFGVVLRVILINTVLLPLALGVRWIASRNYHTTKSLMV